MILRPPTEFGNSQPDGDPSRQAVASLRGYAYQIFAATLAWVDLGTGTDLYLEIAEDYALVASGALTAFQVKDHEASQSITLLTKGVSNAISAYVDLVVRNPSKRVTLRYLTTSEIGTERAVSDRPAGVAGLSYWRDAAAGADVAPLRTLLESSDFSASVNAFVQARTDDDLRRDLLRCIHWDCGAPPFELLRQELEDRLIVIGRTRFQLSTEDAKRLVDILAYKVLLASLQSNPHSRRLNQADLFRDIDEATRVSVSRPALDALLALVRGGLPTSVGDSLNITEPELSGAPLWIIDSDSLPPLSLTIKRPSIEAKVQTTLSQHTAVVLVGSSGVGKTSESRKAAARKQTSFDIADFRDLSDLDTVTRLHALLSHLGGLKSSLLIIDDLNHFDAPQVARTLGRVIEGLRRRDRKAIITSYRAPTPRSLADAGLSVECVMDCPYFSETEVGELVAALGGDTARWARLSYIAGGAGHPQLTHAFVHGLASRGWPLKEVESILLSGGVSQDISATRDAARRQLHQLPSDSRDLLYRLSLNTSRFDRTLAIEISHSPPSITKGGEHFDTLIGPWIEKLSIDQYRVSPLVSSLGREMLSETDSSPIHTVIAEYALKKKAIDVTEVDTILVHAMAGKANVAILKLSNSVITSKESVLAAIAESTIFFRALRTDTVPYPRSPTLSLFLRMAQFKLVAKIGDPKACSATANALLAEARDLPRAQRGDMLECMALGVVLSTLGVGGYLDSWIEHLHRFKALHDSEPDIASFSSNFEARSRAEGGNGSLFTALFSVGITNLASVARLGEVFVALDRLHTAERAIFLAPVHSSFEDYSVIVNGPWAAMAREGNLVAADAAEQYRGMAEVTKPWGIRPLTVQCWVARVAILDEQANRPADALASLSEAELSLGEDIAFTTARARIQWRSGNYSDALDTLRVIAQDVGGKNNVQRAFALREGAISAAQCGEYQLSASWFRDARAAAERANTVDMHAMAVGLEADASISDIQAGSIPAALSGLKKAIEALEVSDPESSRKWSYVHRLVRHAVGWVRYELIRRSGGGGEGDPLKIGPGWCSNPEPNPGANTRTLSIIDSAWYQLAEAEIAAGVEVGLAAYVESWSQDRQIPILAITLPTRRMRVSLVTHNARLFAESLRSYLEAMLYLASEREHIMQMDPMIPERGLVPMLSFAAPFSEALELLAGDAVLAFIVLAAIKVDGVSPNTLKECLISEFSGVFPGSTVLNYFLSSGEEATLLPLDKIVVDVSRITLSEAHRDPGEFFIAGLRLFERARRSNFSDVTTIETSKWIKDGWKRIATEQAFRLKTPRIAVPALLAAVEEPGYSQRATAKLLLVADAAVGFSLAPEYRNQLEKMANYDK